MRVGMAELRLCDGYVPHYKEMVMIAKPLIKLMIDDIGIKETIKRFSDPFWFQSLACALGFEHNYTGATTVTLKAIKEAFKDENDIFILGGKGKNALQVPYELSELEKKGMLNSRMRDILERISKETAKADNSLLQDSYDLYFHTVITDGKKNYAIINQGMNDKEMLVRRYHWLNPLSFEDKNFRSIINNISLDLQSKESKDIKNAIVDIVKDESPEKIVKKALLLSKHYELYKKGLKPLYISKEEQEFFKKISVVPYYLNFPRKMNYEAIKIAHECAREFKDVAMMENIGKSTLRGLAYLSALVYGKEISWEKPQRYCYAFGTKAGKPWYVEREAMKKAGKYLMELINASEIKREQKKEIFKRLAKITQKHFKF